MPRSTERETLPLAGSTSAIFCSARLATATISETPATAGEATDEATGEAAVKARGDGDGDAEPASRAGATADAAPGGRRPVQPLGAAPANPRPPLADSAPAPPSVMIRNARKAPRRISLYLLTVEGGLEAAQCGLDLGVVASRCLAGRRERRPQPISARIGHTLERSLGFERLAVQGVAPPGDFVR